MAGWTIYNKEQLLDGELSIFRIRYPDGTEPKNWYCQFRAANGKRIRKSTKKSNLGDAVDVAKSIYFEARGIEKAGFPADERTFAQVAREFLANLQNAVDAGYESKNKHKRYAGIINNYVLHHFGAMKVSDITEREAEKYKHWRRTTKKGTINVTKNARTMERLKKEYAATQDYETLQRAKGIEARIKNRNEKPPSPSTLNWDLTAVRQVLKFAVKQGYLEKEPTITNESLKHIKNQRPAFSVDEIKLLLRSADERRKTNSHIDSVSRAYRHLFYHFIKVSFLTGLRTTEQLVLRYGDIIFDGNNTRIIVRAEQDGAGKTGFRRVLASPEVYSITKEMRSQSDFSDDDSYVWCHPTGTPRQGQRIKSFKKSFAALMDETGLERDQDGNKRTLYSFRHTYITEMLNKPDGLNLYQLAENVGNTPEVIRRFYGKGIAFDKIESSALLSIE
ncbi:MAG: tyrosine-type recombinase/integrase [Rhodospirillales bacterium]